MKITKIGLVAALVAGAMLVATPALKAQDNKDKKGKGAEMIKERLDKMNEELKLTAEQKPKVEAALKEQGEKMRALREDTSLSQEDRREKFRGMREDLDKKMKGILTTEHYEKYEKMTPPGGAGGKKGDRKKKDN